MSNTQALKTHLPCDDCGSSDALSVYHDHTYCYSCTAFKRTKNNNQHNNENVYKMETNLRPKPFRGLSEDTVKFFGVTVSEDNNTHHYPYYDSNSNIVGTKVRNVINKNFFSQGDIKEGLLFGQNLLSYSFVNNHWHLSLLMELSLLYEVKITEQLFLMLVFLVLHYLNR